ncbi:MAG TPA: amino acid ABC transporter permease [Coriobacteriia bacterium]|jgi:polar amino acid transport system substrate-binding protein
MSTPRRNTPLKAAALVLALASLLVMAGIAPAFSMSGTTVTVSEESGGQPARITFNTVTGANERVSELDLTFPEGFELAKTRTDVVTLEGLKRTPVQPRIRVEGRRLTLGFTPPIAGDSTVRVQVWDVGLPTKGGTYRLAGEIRTDRGVEPVTGDLSFGFSTVSPSEALSRSLERNPLVKRWNSVQFLNFFLNPTMIVLAVPILFTGWITSVLLVVAAFPLAIFGGLGLAFMKMSRFPPLRWVASAYINVIRGTPLFLQIYIGFVGLPIAGVRAPWYVTGIIVLALNSSAYLAEIFRAGIQSIHKGQFEAASSLGMTYWQSMRFVIIPQTVKRVLPTMTSEFILLFKDTALLSAVGVFELMLYSNSLAVRGGNLTPFVVAAVYYLIITIPLINWVATLEAKLAVAEGGQAPAGVKPSLWDRLGMRRMLTPARELREER